jgi:hypothetical protein
MANVFSSNPVYIDTDTTVGGNTNWKGSSGGSKYTGGIGIRPIQIILTPLGATTATEIVINEVKSVGGATGAVLFAVQFPTATATAAVSLQFNLEQTASGWHDFIVTGVTAAGIAMTIYYRV